MDTENNTPAPEKTQKRTTCKNCPSFYDPCLWKGKGDNPAHWIVVGLSPSGFSIGSGNPFDGADGRLFRKLVSNLPQLTQTKMNNNGLRIYYTYAVLHGPGKPKKEALECCTDNLRREIASIRGVDGREPVIIALGPDVARALGVKLKKVDDVLGRFATTSIPTPIGNRVFQVLPLLSVADLNRRQGAVGTLNALLVRAAQMALGLGDTSVYKAPESNQPVPVATTSYRVPKTIEEVRALVEEIRDYTGNANTGPNVWYLSVDTETNTLQMHRPDAKILMVSLAWDTGKAASILLDHPDTPYDREEAWALVKNLLEGEKPKAFHNTKFDYQGLALKYGININNIRWDTMLGEHWLDEDKKGLYGLKKLTPMYAPELAGYDDELQKVLRGAEEQEAKERKLAAKTTDLGEVVGDDTGSAPEVPVKKKGKKAKKVGGYEQVPLDTLLQYAATDADVTRRIVKGQKVRLDKMDKTSEANHVMTNLYLPASKTLAKMEFGGFKVDVDYLQSLEKDIVDLRDSRLEELRRTVNPTVNYSSSPQVQKVMQDMGFDSLPGKEFGTADKEALKAYATKYGLNDPRGKFALDLLAYRTANDAKNKFIDKIKVYTTDHDGRIHTSFHLSGTATGRLCVAGTTMLDVVDSDWKWHRVAIQNFPVEWLGKVRIRTHTGRLHRVVSMIIKGMERMRTVHVDGGSITGTYNHCVLVPGTNGSYWESLGNLELKSDVLFSREDKVSGTARLEVRRVTGITKTPGEQQVWDIEVEEDHSYVAGGLVHHNSSSNPNLQNIPKYVCRLSHKDASGTETTIHKGFNTKKLFIPSTPDFALVNADIKAAELRVYTAYSKDAKMIDALINGTDVHSLVASTAYGVPYDEIMAKKGSDPAIAKMRDSAKRVVFGSFYGAGPNKIAEQIGGTREEGQRLIDMLYETFPALAHYIQVTQDEVKRWGFVRTYFGRYRRFKMASMSHRFYGDACREAVNMKIQSTASDLLLSQLIEIDEHIGKELGGRLIITVHDSIVFELPKDNVPLVKPFLTKYITERVKERFVWLAVPFEFDWEVGENYGELKGMK